MITLLFHLENQAFISKQREFDELRSAYVRVR